MAGTHNESRTIVNRVRAHARESIAIDTRTLAAFRMFIGVVVFVDLLVRSTRFFEYYTDGGLFSQALAHEYAGGWVFSFHLVSDNLSITMLLFVVHALIAVQFIIGYKTRLAAILMFLFAVSLHTRNPLLLNSGDTLLRLLLFWGIFLPLGERWSVDAVHRERAPRARIASIASAAILFQVVFMYLGNAIQKAVGDHWLQGEATPLVFGLDQLMWLLAPYVREFPALLSVAGWVWFGLLALFSWQLLIVFGRARTILTFCFILVHLSFALTMRIGLFSFVAMAGVALFLQAPFWDDLIRIVPTLASRWALTMRDRLSRMAMTLPRFDPHLLLPQRVTTAGYNSIVIAAVIGILVMPPLTFLDSNGIMRTNVTLLESPIRAATSALNITQPKWAMFAPNPLTKARYYVFVAERRDGEVIDIFNNRPLSFDRPEGKLYEQFDHYRDRKYLRAIASDDHEARLSARQELGAYICRTWEESHGAGLRQIDMYVVHEQITIETISDYTGRDRWAELFYQHGCDGPVAGEIAPPDLQTPAPAEAAQSDGE